MSISNLWIGAGDTPKQFLVRLGSRVVAALSVLSLRSGAYEPID